MQLEHHGHDRVAHQRYPYEAYSRLAGEARRPPTDRPYVVEHVSLQARDGTRGRTALLAGGALVCELGFLLWLLHPSHLPVDDRGWQYPVSLAMVACVAVIEGLRLLNVLTLALATYNACDPVPVVPEPGLRAAFLTTIVPGKEPVEMARATLEAALQVRHDGPYAVWLLDEGDDPEVRAMCAELGVRHFTRKGVPHWNQPSGRNKAKTKHGNYNAWLDAHGDDYDVWLSVDTDHVPLPNFGERLLGYFRDPDVAFVVGPQVYGNYDGFITRAAESQQYLFHGVLQRAANRYGAAMLVGTNNAVRISALRAIGGLQDSITEDAATSLEWHGRRNPVTGRRWKSVYTPDVLAVGEGPTSWTDYFIQQSRWARGTNEVVLRKFVHLARRLTPGRALHYGLLMSYYPSAAVSWALGTATMTTYLVTGSGGVLVPARLWLALYVNAAVLQLGIYFWNRRHNVSPHEESGSSGVAGMFVSVLSAPVYVTALLDAVRGRNVPFAVTPKGDSGSPDRVLTFRKHLQWGAVLAVALAASFPLGNDHPAMRGWALLGLVVCLLPLAIWWLGSRRGGPAPEPQAPDAPHAPVRTIVLPDHSERARVARPAPQEVS